MEETLGDAIGTLTMNGDLTMAWAWALSTEMLVGLIHHSAHRTVQRTMTSMWTLTGTHLVTGALAASEASAAHTAEA